MQNVYDSNGIRKINSLSTLNVDTPAFDAFGRLRVSSPETIFDSKLSYDTGSALWNQTLTGGGTAVHRQNESSVRMTVSAAGDKVVRQTYQYFPYRPGKGLQIAMTFVMSAYLTNVRTQLGFFDDNNGIFFRRGLDGLLSFVRRTYVTGSAANTIVTQSNWNLDKLDGTGPSGVTLDVTKTQILIIDLQWLGVGRVRLGFDIDGVFYPAHEFLNANSLATVYMTTATLPLRYEIEATTPPPGTSYIDQICSAVISDGGFDSSLGFPRAIGQSTTPISITARVPILSIRPKATYGGITNRMYMILERFQVFAQTTTCRYELVWNGALTGAAFASAGTNSAMEYDTTASAITGGDIIDYGFCPANVTINGTVSRDISSRLPLSLDAAGANPINLTIVATRNAGSGTCNVQGAMLWREIQ